MSPHHRTHVAGLIGARPRRSGQFVGTAPSAELFSARFLEAGVAQIDLANALEALSDRYEVDLINLSLSSDFDSGVVHDAILDALDAGTVCVCAAGNSHGTLEFPAAWPETVAVGAIGKVGWGSTNSIALESSNVPSDLKGHLGFFSPMFSCAGDPAMIVAPGVGIVSTVPDVRAGESGPYGEMSGTSMASPIACGTIAALLSRNGMRRSQKRTDRVQSVHSFLLGGCCSAGLDPKREGRGILRVSA